jgi:hypothetical protein
LFQFTKSRVPFVLVLVRFAQLQALKTISASTLNCSSLERGVLRENWLRELNSLGLETFALKTDLIRKRRFYQAALGKPTDWYDVMCHMAHFLVVLNIA